MRNEIQGRSSIWSGPILSSSNMARLTCATRSRSEEQTFSGRRRSSATPIYHDQIIGEVVLNQIGRLALPVANPRPRTIALPSAVSKQLPRPDTGSAAPVDPTIAELDAFLPAVKPASRDGNKWRGPRGQDETEKSDHFVSLGDFIA